MTQIDPRIAERRRDVREQRATGSLKKALVLLILAVVIAVAVWVLRSPLFSVAAISVTGASTVPATELLAEAGITTGLPLMSVDTGDGEAALEAHPWVREATVVRSWPDLIEVRVEERYPVAWARLDSGWALLSLDGVALDTAEAPHEGAPMLTGAGGEPVGEPTGRLVESGLAFLDALRPDLAGGAVVTLGDEVTAEVAGFSVRLGGPVDMADKARVLAAVLDSEPEMGSSIVLVAPTRPALMPPGGPPPLDGEEVGEAEPGEDQGEEPGDATVEEPPAESEDG